MTEILKACLRAVLSLFSYSYPSFKTSMVQFLLCIKYHELRLLWKCQVTR